MVAFMFMRQRMKITRGGQISVPAEIRRRWGTDQVVLADEGDRIVVEPVSSDAIDRAAGAFRHHAKGIDLAQVRAAEREAEQEREEHRLRALGWGE